MLKLKPTNRLRKTKDPCPNCSLNRALCLCSLIPSLHLKTKICLIIHAKELKRTTNTGRLALKALINSEMRVRGETHEPVDLSDLLVPEYRTLLFYPSEEARELTREFIAEDPRPIQLLVPDGNWRQASKVHGRHPELSDVVRVKISTANTSEFHLRVEHMEEGMATLEAIAEALAMIEGEEVGKKLRDLYQEKLRRTLQGRGQKMD
jgi:DTW domain-containing protein YfiP